MNFSAQAMRASTVLWLKQPRSNALKTTYDEQSASEY